MFRRGLTINRPRSARRGHRRHTVKLLILDRGKPYAVVDHCEKEKVRTIEVIIALNEEAGRDYVYVPDNFPITEEERGRVEIC